MTAWKDLVASSENTDPTGMGVPEEFTNSGPRLPTEQDLVRIG